MVPAYQRREPEQRHDLRIRGALAEKAKDAARRTQDRDAAFAVRLAVKLVAWSVKGIALKREAALEAERIRRKAAEQKKRKKNARGRR